MSSTTGARPHATAVATAREAQADVRAEQDEALGVLRELEAAVAAASVAGDVPTLGRLRKRWEQAHAELAWCAYRHAALGTLIAENFAPKAAQEARTPPRGPLVRIRAAAGCRDHDGHQRARGESFDCELGHAVTLAEAGLAYPASGLAPDGWPSGIPAVDPQVAPQ